jgi:glycine betaine/choline ABC-type transport system substrate-binding protein
MRRGHFPALLMAVATLACAVLLAACGDNGNSSTGTGSTSGQLIQRNADNAGKKLTVGSKNFTEEFILGEIYAQALQAAG